MPTLSKYARREKVTRRKPHPSGWGAVILTVIRVQRTIGSPRQIFGFIWILSNFSTSVSTNLLISQHYHLQYFR